MLTVILLSKRGQSPSVAGGIPLWQMQARVCADGCPGIQRAAKLEDLS